MKKTLFLTAILGAVIAVPSMAADQKVDLTTANPTGAVPDGIADGDTLTINVGTAETPVTNATWTPQVNYAVTSTVNINAGSTLTAGSSTITHEKSLFTNSGAQTVNVGEGATLNTNASLSGWANNAPTTLEVNLSSGATWNINSENGDKCEYLANTTINLTGAGIVLSDDRYIRAERGSSNSINALAAAEMSTITGGTIMLQNTDLTVSAARGTFTLDSTNTADLKITSAVVPGNQGNKSFTKTGDGTLEMAGSVTIYNFNVNAGTVNFTNDVNVTNLTAASGTTVTLSGSNVSLSQIAGAGTVTVSNATIAASGTLWLGLTDTWNPGSLTPTKLNLAGLTVSTDNTAEINYATGTIGEVTLSGGTLYYRDSLKNEVNDDYNLVTISQLNVTAASTLRNEWKGQLTITKLTGDSNISMTKDYGGYFYLTVGLEDYAGTLNAPESNAGSVKLTLSGASQAEGKDATLALATTLKAGFTKTGDGKLTISGNTTASGDTSEANAININGGELALTGTTNSLQRLKIADNATLTLGGTTTIAGLVDISMSNATVGATMAITSGTTTIQGNLWLSQSDKGTKVSIAKGATLAEGVTGFSYTGNNADTAGTITDASDSQQIELVRNDSGTGWGQNANKVNTLFNDLDVTYAGTSDYTFEGNITNGSVTVAEDAGTLTLSHTDLSLTNLTANSDVTISADTSVSGSVTVADGATLSVTNGASLNLAATDVTISNITLNGGTVTLGHEATTLTTTTLNLTGESTINSNLTVTKDGTMTFGKDAVLTMGCNVTIGSNVTLNLSDAAQESAAAGNLVQLFSSVESLTVDGTTYTIEGESAITEDQTIQGVFENYQDADHLLVYKTDGSVWVTPEPATATLSLLALAGLCARRRRH